MYALHNALIPLFHKVTIIRKKKIFSYFPEILISIVEVRKEVFRSKFTTAPTKFYLKPRTTRQLPYICIYFSTACFHLPKKRHRKKIY